MKIFPNKTENSKGFTLIETLVAVAIFSASVTALISITARGINDNVFVKNKLIASYLAQEGIELVRNMRDTAALGGNLNWNQFIASPDQGILNCYSSTTAPRSCIIDATADVLIATECGENGCEALKYEPLESKYGYFGFDDSPFTRTITIRPPGDPNGPGYPGSPDEIFVTSEVSWRAGSNVHRVFYYYNLLNWIDP